MIDQQHNADLQPQPSVFYKKILFILVIAFAFIAILGAILWYADVTQLSPRPTPSPQQTFSPSAQFIPQRAIPLSITDALHAFNFPKPLPFFDERNVVQSLEFGVPSTTPSATSTSQTKETVKPAPSTSFLSYRIYGQSVVSVREALTRYFVSLGWKQMDDGANQGYLSFGFDHGKIISVNMLERPATPGTEPRITVTLSLYISYL